MPSMVHKILEMNRQPFDRWHVPKALLIELWGPKYVVCLESMLQHT